MHGEAGKGSRRRPEDRKAITRNWPWPERGPCMWDPADPDHPRHRQWARRHAYKCKIASEQTVRVADIELRIRTSEAIPYDRTFIELPP